ncbi:hypothetical protein QJQ45_014083, partial [Haematococcus lacustris]
AGAAASAVAVAAVAAAAGWAAAAVAVAAVGEIGAAAAAAATGAGAAAAQVGSERLRGRFENASVEFDEVALAPTYRLLWGIPGRSNALNIAARLGLEEEVVAAARSRLDDSVVRADTAVAALEEVRDTVQGEESALWAVEQEVAAIQAEVTARRIEVRVLQSELAAATEKALFDVWLEARRRLRQIRQAKRAPAPAVKRALSPAQALEVLATQITNPGQQELQGSGSSSSSSSSSRDKDRDSATSPHTQRVSPAPPSHLAPGAQPVLDQVGATARAAAGEEEEGDDDEEEEGEVGEQQEEDEMSVSLEELQGLDMSMEQLLEQQIEMRQQARLMAAEKERLAEQAYESAVMGFEQLITAMPVAPPSRQAVAPHPPPSTAVSVPNEQEGVQEEDIEELEQQFPAASVIQQQSAKDTRRQQKSGRTVGAQSQNQQHHQQQQQQQQQQQGAEKEVVAGVTASQVSYDDEYELLFQQWEELQAQVHSSRQAPAPAAPTASKQTATEAASAPFDALDLDELIQGLEDASDVRLKLAPEPSHISPRSSSRHSAASQNDVMTQRTQRGASANNARLQSDDAAMSEEDELSSLITMLEELPQPPKFDFSGEVLDAFQAVKAAGSIPKWGVALEATKRRSVMQNELRQVGIKNPGAIAVPSVRNDAAFLATVVLSTSVLAVIAGVVLPGDLGGFAAYGIGGISIVVLAIGSTSPGLLQFFIDKFSLIFPDYKERVTRHEAAHFLVGYLAGCPVTSYSILLGQERVEFAEARLQKRLYEKWVQQASSSNTSSITSSSAGSLVSTSSTSTSTGGIAWNPSHLEFYGCSLPGALLCQTLEDEEVDTLAIVAVAGIAAEGQQYEEVMGQTADLLDLQRILLRSKSKLSDQAQQNMTRWAVMTAGGLLRRVGPGSVGCGREGLSSSKRADPMVVVVHTLPQYKKEHEAVIAAMSRGASVFECIRAIEEAGPA